MNKKLKILIINTYFYNDGGAEIIAYHTYRLLKEHGIDVYFWSSDKKPYFDDKYEYIPYFTRFNGTVKDYLLNPFEFYYNNKAKKDLQIFIDKIKPDLIHIHSFKTCLTSSILECCKDIPTIMTVHDPSLFCPAVTFMKNYKEYCKNQLCKGGKFYHCLLNRCSKGKFEPSLRLTIKSYIFNKNIKYIDKFLTPSDAMKKLIVNADIGISEDKIRTVNNFLSEEELNTAPNYDNKGYFLYIGRLSKEKGVHYLLEAFKDLPKDINLHIVGSGAREKYLKEYVQKNNMTNVKFFGFLNHEEARKQYKDCIASIIPCNWFETFGMTIIESYINGKPVIGSKIAAIPEIIENNKTGFLFEPGNINQLKEAILTYWNNKQLSVEHGKNAYEKAIKKYTQEVYLKNLLEIYEGAIKNEL